MEFHSSEAFKTRPGKELAKDREHMEQSGAHRPLCHCFIGAAWKMMMLSRKWELPWEGMGGICFLSAP